MKEHNLRIKFEDTSTIAGFPTNDWQITANDSASGGLSKMSIDDVTGARTPFTVEAGTPTNTLYLDSTGRVGFRTATPVLDLHANTGNTPGIRLEQNSSGGWTAQTWDIAGNEANWFVRDVTGGSRLPFRIRPGAPTSSIDISASGNVGIGTSGPGDKLDVREGAILITDPDVAHGVTGFAPTTAAVKLYSYDATQGAGTLHGFTDAAGGPWGLALSGMLTSDPTDTVPAVLIAGARASGTGQAALAANETVLQVTNQLDGGTVLMTVLGSGHVGIAVLAGASASDLCYDTTTISGSNTVSTCSSSLRYKEDVRQLVVDKAKVLALSPIDFKWKGRAERGVGLAAEDVERILPQLVGYAFDNEAVQPTICDVDGKCQPDPAWVRPMRLETVRYKELTVYLLEILKEHDRTIGALTSRLASLEKDLAALKAKR